MPRTVNGTGYLLAKCPLVRFSLLNSHLTGYRGQLLVGEGVSWLTTPRGESRGRQAVACIPHELGFEGRLDLERG